MKDCTSKRIKMVSALWTNVRAATWNFVVFGHIIARRAVIPFGYRYCTSHSKHAASSGKSTNSCFMVYFISLDSLSCSIITLFIILSKYTMDTLNTLAYNRSTRKSQTPSPRWSGGFTFINNLIRVYIYGHRGGDRTHTLIFAKVTLYQLSYPIMY